MGDVGKCQSGIGFPDAKQGGKSGTPFYKVSDMNNFGVIGNNHGYRFIDQLSIFDRRASATACGKFDFWREQFDRTVMRGEKGILILCDYGNFKRVEYVYDVSRTVSRNNEVNEVNLWQFDREDDLVVLRKLIEENGFEYGYLISRNFNLG